MPTGVVTKQVPLLMSVKVLMLMGVTMPVHTLNSPVKVPPVQEALLMEVITVSSTTGVTVTVEVAVSVEVKVIVVVGMVEVVVEVMVVVTVVVVVLVVDVTVVVVVEPEVRQLGMSEFSLVNRPLEKQVFTTPTAQRDVSMVHWGSKQDGMAEFTTVKRPLEKHVLTTPTAQREVGSEQPVKGGGTIVVVTVTVAVPETPTVVPTVAVTDVDTVSITVTAPNALTEKMRQRHASKRTLLIDQARFMIKDVCFKQLNDIGKEAGARKRSLLEQSFEI